VLIMVGTTGLGGDAGRGRRGGSTSAIHVISTTSPAAYSGI